MKYFVGLKISSKVPNQLCERRQNLDQIVLRVYIMEQYPALKIQWGKRRRYKEVS